MRTTSRRSIPSTHRSSGSLASSPNPTSESTELEKQVQALEQSIVDTREEFLKIGHGGKNKHLAGSHENEIIADLENQLKDKHYELEKTRQQKYKLYVQEQRVQLRAG